MVFTYYQKFLSGIWEHVLKMTSEEMIHRSYECSPLLGIFSCVKNAKPCLDKLSQSFSDIFHNSFNCIKLSKSLLKGLRIIIEYLINVFTIEIIQHEAKF